MRQLPAYLQKKSTAIEAGALSNATDPYRPLVAGWLIEMALCLGWYRKRRPHCLPEIFSDDEFVAATEIAVPGERDEDGDVATAVVRRTSDADFARCLKRRLVAVRKVPVGADLPLFRNVELLAQILGLGETEKAVLTFIGALNAIQSFRGNNYASSGNLKALAKMLFRGLRSQEQSKLDKAAALVEVAAA